MLRIWLLGLLRLEVDGVEVAPPSSRRARLLLAMLALERRPHSRAHAPLADGREAGRAAAPTGECKAASRWIKASRIHLLVPRDTDRWRKFYKRRGSGIRPG